MLLRQIRRLGLAASIVLCCIPALAKGDNQLLTGPQGTARNQIGSELAGFVAPFVESPLKVVAVPGPTDMLQRLREAAGQSDGMTVALLQADIAQLYLLAAEQGNPDAAAWLAPLRVIAPLYSEELHFIVRSDSPLKSVQDIRDTRIAVGPITGGTALSVATLYRQLFDKAPNPAQLSRLQPEEALTKLLTDHSVDVVALLADQPAPLLANMKPAARNFVRLLPFIAESSGSAKLGPYQVSALRAASYPNLIGEDVPALSVQLYLVTSRRPEGASDAPLVGLANAYCSQLPLLKESGLARWKDVALGFPPLAPGWHYSRPAAAALSACLGIDTATIPDTCLPQEKKFGLCDTNAP
jgi:uncharacterized protein